MGIAAKFAGTCPICRQSYEVGDQIDRVNPGDSKSERGHVDCVAGNGRATGSTRATQPAARPTTNGYAGNGAGYATGGIPAAATLEAIRQGLVQAIEANKESANALDAAREGLEYAVNAIDAALASQRTPVGSRR